MYGFLARGLRTPARTAVAVSPGGVSYRSSSVMCARREFHFLGVMETTRPAEEVPGWPLVELVPDLVLPVGHLTMVLTIDGAVAVVVEPPQVIGVTEVSTVVVGRIDDVGRIDGIVAVDVAEEAVERIGPDAAGEAVA